MLLPGLKPRPPEESDFPQTGKLWHLKWWFHSPYSENCGYSLKSENMATGSTIPGSRVEQRGLAYWMERVLEELDEVRTAPEADAVHDLRVALRRCRSLARGDGRSGS